MDASCCVCSAGSPRYRCPACRLRYCSLGCCRKHKEGCAPEDAQNPSGVTAVSDVLPTQGDLLEESDESDTVPSQRLMLLDTAQGLKDLLLNKYLRQLLMTLDQTENKDEALEKYMQEPLFVEFADKCLVLLDAEEKENLFPK
ncbi:zinc finger [Pristimantis euphronides]